MSTILWTGFLFLIAGFLGFSLILIHHWGYYGIKNNKKVFAKGLYFVGAVFLLIIVGVSFMLYETTL